jgi:hypothetical protein
MTLLSVCLFATPKRLKSGIVGPKKTAVVRQRLGKPFPAATITYATKVLYYWTRWCLCGLYVLRKELALPAARWLLTLSTLDSEDGSSIFLQKIGELLPHCTVTIPEGSTAIYLSFFFTPLRQ